MVSRGFVSIGWGDDLSPDGTKPSPDPILTNPVCLVSYLSQSIFSGDSFVTKHRKWSWNSNFKVKLTFPPGGYLLGYWGFRLLTTPPRMLFLVILLTWIVDGHVLGFLQRFYLRIVSSLIITKNLTCDVASIGMQRNTKLIWNWRFR